MDNQAAVLRETKGRLSVETVDIAEPGPGEVRVRIGASGLCHTDWETMHGLQPCNLPAVLGHEGAGVVESVGAGVRLAKVGSAEGLGASIALISAFGPLAGRLLAQNFAERP